jgi:TetR/AcrR family transcriptional regulator, transcriptional repressor for nem operon
MPKPNVREKVVQAGLDLFHRSGFNASSVEDITDLAEVPKGSFYNHFKGKEELALEVIGRYVEGGSHSVLADTAIAPLARLKRYFAALTETFARSGYKKGCLLGNFSSELADHSARVRSRLEAAFDDWVKRLADVIREAQEAGEVDSKIKAEQLASFLLSAFEGALLRARAANDPAPLKDFASVAFSHLIR